MVGCGWWSLKTIDFSERSDARWVLIAFLTSEGIWYILNQSVFAPIIDHAVFFESLTIQRKTKHLEAKAVILIWVS